MPHILLLGAGFSRNWGGPLASEVFDHLIGLHEIQRDEYLRNLLWTNRNSGGFENVLAEVQIAFIGNPQRFGESMQRLQRAVTSLFQRMNQAFFDHTEMEFQQFQDRMLRTFLFRFDAIFTLNQDVFLEHHYVRHVDMPTVRDWHGAQLPGMQRVPNPEYVHDPSWGKDLWVPLDPSQFRIEDHRQPLFKLHGSSNWQDAQGNQLLIIGGNKSRAIQSHAVLAWSFEKFQDYLARPETKLFIIGYGFRDSHINQAIIDAVANHNLRFFVTDQWGSDVVRHANPSFGGAIYAPNALDDAFRNGLIGASERNLSETFGNDQISYENVMRFFG